jgi:Ca2+-binding EF-hand superfamily protein
LKLHQPKKDWAYFEDWDKNHNSNLDREEFAQGYDQAGFFTRWGAKLKSISTTDFLQQSFEAFDENKDEVLDSTEYKSRRVLWSYPGEMDLEQWDTNHDKVLAARPALKGKVYGSNDCLPCHKPVT